MADQNLRSEVLRKTCTQTHVPSPGDMIVTKTGLFACQKQLYSLTAVMPPSPSTHTCAHCPSKSSWVISLGGRTGEGLNERFMGKSGYWHLKISHKVEDSKRVTL